MCGLVGVLDPRCRDDLEAVTSRMADTLAHRGPDDAGVWVDREAGVGLAHRRLSILDLSPAGHQPMVSACGRYVIAFNGEVYNHLELRRALASQGQAPAWRGHSDTETLLAVIEASGVAEALQRCVGMFALALWDRAARTLTLARDRLGEKPLYYGGVRGALVFASELKAIRAYPGFDNPIERRALALFLRHNYIPAPWSIYMGIWKLPPGCYVQFGTGQTGAVQLGRGEVKPYWSLRAVAQSGLNNPFAGTEAEAVEELDRLLRRSIAEQMIADVPLGAFLSGGVDSSTVVALMQAQSTRPVRTFTIGFEDAAYDEAPQARRVAEFLKTDHTELYVSQADVLGVIPSLARLYDEPFADSSQIPVALLCSLAKRHVTVSLSGDGGDESFAGYDRYLLSQKLWRAVGWLPGPLRGLWAHVMTAIPAGLWQDVVAAARGLLPAQVNLRGAGEKMHVLAEIMTAKDRTELYHRLVSHWRTPAEVVTGAGEPGTLLAERDWAPRFERFLDHMLYVDTVSYLPDDLLVKVDRASMGVSLEVRCPLLDHRVVEFAWRLPGSMKVRNGQGKWILRKVLDRYVPRELVERPKMGFGVPLAAWLRGPLRDWAEALLEEGRLRREGFFDPRPIREKWREHLSGERNWQYHLWDVLMVQAWLEQWR